ncbi:MAG: mandelate racemase/muconate lactonizing enzyme family protein, partial [Phycisphaeraceae bacterium]|nr:mandelate racemase/muconate lactonizing enzyme family protein [Phycisphaeraceae bacterium]
YLSMPVIEDVGDGSQDVLLVRAAGGVFTGWGECEAAPLPSIAAWCCPMSHSACKPVRDSVLGQKLDGPDDIARINRLVRENGLDLLQTDHTLSGIDIALWDLLGKAKQQPVYELLGYDRACPKTPYASQLFGETPQQTLDKARATGEQGYRAVKFGWMNYGRGSVEDDRDHVAAAREGIGDDGLIMIDAGTVWIDDVAQAKQRLAALNEHRVLWLEEPFVSGALSAYAELAADCGDVKLAAGEGAHNFYMAQHLIDHGRIGYLQIDTGRIGGITTAKAAADYAHANGVTYINHTFTSHLALSASLQPFAGIEADVICEYPVEPRALANELTRTRLELNAAGQVELPVAPGLGIEIDPETIDRYHVDVQIEVDSRKLF